MTSLVLVLTLECNMTSERLLHEAKLKLLQDNQRSAHLRIQRYIIKQTGTGWFRILIDDYFYVSISTLITYSATKE